MADAVHVSRRTMVAIGVAGALVIATWKVAAAVSNQIDRVDELERVRQEQHLRTCRIEKALQIDPWPNCPVQ